MYANVRCNDQESRRDGQVYRCLAGLRSVLAEQCATYYAQQQVERRLDDSL